MATRTVKRQRKNGNGMVETGHYGLPCVTIVYYFVRMTMLREKWLRFLLEQETSANITQNRAMRNLSITLTRIVKTIKDFISRQNSKWLLRKCQKKALGGYLFAKRCINCCVQAYNVSPTVAVTYVHCAIFAGVVKMFSRFSPNQEAK